MKKIQLVFALGVIALLAGCSNILSPPEGSAPKTGIVTLRVDQGLGGGARTVFPAFSQFTRVALSFTELEGSPALAEVEVIDGTATINLPAGKWDVTADAYTENGLAAQSSPHTLEWTGTGDVSGETRFALLSIGGGSGTLKGAVTLPGEMTLGAGSFIRITKLSDQSVSLEQPLTDGIEDDIPLDEGRYYVDVVLEDNDSGDTAVFHRTVVIMGGLYTELRFEPESEDFLSEEARAALTNIEGLIFGATETNASNIVDIDDEDFVNGNIAITALGASAELHFTVVHPAFLNLRSDEAVLVSSAEGSYSSSTLSVFEVDASEADDITVTIVAVEEGKEAIPITVTVKVLSFGLYVGTGDALDRVDNPITDLSDAFGWLALNAVDNTNYVILLDDDDGLTQYTSRVGSVGVTVTLRGLVEERTVTYKTGAYAGTPSGLIHVNAGTTFVLGENITLDGNDTQLYSTNGGMVYLYQGGRFVMMPGSKITRVAGYQAVRLNGSSAAPVYFTMRGGLISNNNARAVYNQVYTNGATNAFIVMEDGEICNNQLPASPFGYDSAAVALGAGFDFTMRDGSIRDNPLRGVVSEGNGTFRMEGGVISGNGSPTRAGPYNLGTAYSNSNSTYVVIGAGVLFTGGGSYNVDFIMTGGKILDNGTTDAVGSGIYMGSGNSHITLDGPVEISGNNINVLAATNSSQNPVTVGSSFENKGVSPITVDMTGGATTAANLKTWWGTTTPIVTDVSKLSDFTPGKAGLANSNTFTLFANGYTINSSTGCLVDIP
jgi:hypothetical protein